MKHILASNGFVLRTPLLPFADWLSWRGNVRERQRVRAQIGTLLARPEVEEALFIASPSLHQSLPYWHADPESARGRKIERTLVKYLSRMAGRATPFGLFSGISVGQIGTQTILNLSATSSYERHTRLDNDFLFAWVSAVGTDPHVRAHLCYRPNSSLYRAAGRLRYAEARLNGKERSYHLVSVEPSEPLQATLERAREGARLEALAAALVSDDATIEPIEAACFVNELVEAQLLVPDLGVAVTGPEPLKALLYELQKAHVTDVSSHLDGVHTQLAAIDQRGIGVEPACYLQVAHTLKASSTEVPVEISRLFQVDMVKPASQAELSRSLVADIERGIDVLQRISPRVDHSLADFCQAFQERYGDREVSLVEALDEESGIGFEAADAPGTEGSPLLAGLDFPGLTAPVQMEWSEREAYLLRRWHDALSHDEAELVLDDEDIQHLSFDEPARLPRAFAAIVRVAAPAGDAIHRGEPRILLDGISGPSGARLLGRFCHVSAAVHELVNDHLRAEEAQAPDAVFAEIVHLNEGRIGNILCRPVLRDYEIPFLGISGAPSDGQLPITDLLVTVRQGRAILRSRRLKRQVIPRLTTAHNFRLRSLGIYRFLSTLQNQAYDPIEWRWGALAEAPRLPRVRYKRLVFARAQWRLTSLDVAPIVEAVGAESRATTPGEMEACRADTQTAMRRLQAARGLPRFVVLAEGDNELPIDFDNVLSAETFAYTLASGAAADRASVILYEQFPSPDDLVVQGPEGAFTHEVVIPFVHAEAQPLPAMAAAPPIAATRSFPPGSPWLYAKLYTGQSTADRVLREAIAPVVQEAMATGDADRWFFLRYRDPEHHLRVRFHGEPERLYGTVLPALHRALSPLMQEGAVWRMQLDTYERETERYGGVHGIDLAEELFWIDSETVLAIVACLDGDAGKDARWRLALRGANLLLDCFGLDSTARRRVFTRASDSFSDEFRVTTALRKQIGHLFRTERADLEALLDNDLERTREHPLTLGFDFLDQGAQRQRLVAADLHARAQQGQLHADIEDMAWSFVHMHINRLLHASQRAQELVIYDLLKRYHESRRAYATRT